MVSGASNELILKYLLTIGKFKLLGHTPPKTKIAYQKLQLQKIFVFSNTGLAPQFTYTSFYYVFY